MPRIDAHAVLFDMDGTLVDSTPIVELAWGRFAAKHSLDVAHILATSHGVKAIDSVIRYGPGGIDITAEAAEIAAFEMASLEGIMEIAGAIAFSEAIPAGQFAIVTSAPRELALLRLEYCGFVVPAVVVAAEDVDNGKPHPEPYLLAASSLGIHPSQCVVFEDAPAGIRSGLAAGMQVVVVGDADDAVTVGLPRIRDYFRVGIEGSSGAGFTIVL
jgi:sugar-phosphatase